MGLGDNFGREMLNCWQNAGAVIEGGILREVNKYFFYIKKNPGDVYLQSVFDLPNRIKSGFDVLDQVVF